MRAVYVVFAAAVTACATAENSPHLFLSLMADAGIYDYEPSAPDRASSGT